MSYYYYLVVAFGVFSHYAAFAHLFPKCPPVSGTLEVNIPQLYPESGDWDSVHCMLYAGSTTNNTLLQYDLYSNTSRIFSFPGELSDPSVFFCGIDYHSASNSIFISVNARNPFYTNGLNLTGPNYLVRWSISSEAPLYISSMATIQSQVFLQTGKLIGGFQDMAEDTSGNSYYLATWGNVLVKVNPQGLALLYYLPNPSKLNNTAAGFGGIFSLGNKLIASDGISKSFLVFDTAQSPHIGKPSYVFPSNMPKNYSTALICDALYAPPKYRGTIALCSDDFLDQYGAIVVYESRDEWKTARYVGRISNNNSRVAGQIPSAPLEMAGSVYISEATLPSPNGEFGKKHDFLYIDITKKLDVLVKEL